MLIKPGQPGKLHDITGTVTRYIANLIERRKLCVLLAALTLAVVSVIGISRLSVENSFISYFKSSTEIYQGMKLIDLELGGTTPLDVIIDAPKSYYQEKAEEETDAYIGTYGDYERRKISMSPVPASGSTHICWKTLTRCIATWISYRKQARYYPSVPPCACCNY